MLTRNIRPLLTWSFPRSVRRLQSTSSQDAVLVDIDGKTGISTVFLNQKPVNSMTLNLLKDFCEKMDFLEKEKVKGMILTSSVKNVFSSGLDFKELINPEESRVNAYWICFQEAMIKLYGSSFPTVALINGHSPAGGCVFALSCEYRVMLPNFTIGLNEVPVGIIPPKFVIDCALNVLSRRQAEMMLTLGTLFTSDEALEIGMVDELATDEVDAHTRCEGFVKKCSKIPPLARALTKQQFRRDTLEYLKTPQSRSEDGKRFVGHILRPSTQADLGNYIANLKKTKKQ